MTVSDATAEFHADFVRDVAPVLSRLGCNAGTCHGAQAGKNGFKLSLRGYDPLFDVRALTDDLASRRVTIASPDDSLMLLKPTGAVPHVGGSADPAGRAVLRDDPFVDRRRRQAERRFAARRQDRDRADRPDRPVARATSSSSASWRPTPTAGSRDVTREAFIESGNTEVATADKAGLMTAVRRGEAPMLARYEGAYAATTLTVMGDRTRLRLGAAAGLQLDRRAGRRQVEADEDPALRALHRRRVHPPRLPRPHRPAADGRRRPRLPRRPARRRG